jgi:hypothetical protein
MAIFVGFHGAGVLEASLNALTPGLFWQILESVILTQANSIPQREARVETAVGLTRLLAELPTLVTDPARTATLNTLITTIVELCEPLRSAYAVGVVGGSGSGFVEERDTGDMVVSCGVCVAAAARRRSGEGSGRVTCATVAGLFLVTVAQSML